MDVQQFRARLPATAASILFAIGCLALLLAVVLVFFALPLSRYIGYSLVGLYQYVLAGFAVLGGGMHLLAGWWAWHRQGLFQTVFVTLVGMVLLQVSFPLDVIALLCIGLSRQEFESG